MTQLRLLAVVALLATAACSPAETPRAEPTGAPTTASPTPAKTKARTPSPKPTKSRTATPTATPTRTAAAPDTAARLTRDACGAPGAARTVTFRIAVDAGLPSTAAEFGSIVRSIICDKRSWIGSGEVRFRYDPNGSMLIGLRTPDNAERRCYALIRLSVNRFYSCGTPQEVVINSDRWFKNSPYWPGPLEKYRQMLTNHEVGHGLLLHHTECPRDGAPAPVMMQQSKGMNLNGNRCEPNPWPLSRELDLLR